MKKISSFITILLLLCSFSYGQEATTSATKSLSNAEMSNTPHEVGIAAGFVTGYGLSYRYWPQKMGIQFTAFPLISADESYFSFGANGLLELDSRKWYRFFAYLGGNVNIQSYDAYVGSNYDPNTGNYSSYTERVNETRYTCGFGPGIEFTPGGKIGFNIMTGFQFYYEDSDEWGTAPSIEGGVYFRF